MQENVQLVQRIFPFRWLTLSLIGNRQLQIESKGLFGSTRHTYNLGEIDPSPFHQRRIAVGWAIGTLFFFLMNVAVLYDTAKGDGFSPDKVVGFLVLVALTLALLVNTIRLSHNIYVFRSANAQTLLFNIGRSTPTEVEVDKFVETLAARIDSFRTPQGMTPAQLNEHFLKALDYLHENDVLSQSEYAGAKSRIEAKQSARVVELVRK